MQNSDNITKSCILPEVRTQLVLDAGDRLISEVPIANPSIAVDVMKKYFLCCDREHCCVVHLDTQLKPIAYTVIAIGGIDKCAVPIANVFKAAILQNAASIMMFHNHPSGTVDPSIADVVITQRVASAGKMLDIPLIDHIIIGSQTAYTYSFASNSDIVSNPKKYDGDKVYSLIREKNYLYHAKSLDQQLDDIVHQLTVIDNEINIKKKEELKRNFEKNHQYSQILISPHTPLILQKVGMHDKPILYTVKHFIAAISPIDYSHRASRHNHNLSVDKIKKIPEALQDPVLVYDSLEKDKDAVVVVTDMLDSNKKPIICVLKPDGNGMYNGQSISSNFALSIYPRNNLNSQINRAFYGNKLLYINNEKSQNLSSLLRISLPECLDNLACTQIIRQSENITIGEYEIMNNIRELSDKKTDYSSSNESNARVTEYRKSVADQFLKLLDKDNPVDAMLWVRHWQTIGNPRNVLTNIYYRGTNAFLLSLVQINKGYKDPRWITFAGTKQIEGAHVKKGEHGTKIQRWLVKDLTKKKGEKGAIIDFPERDRLIKEEGRGWGEFGVFPIVSTVFNVEQCEGIPLLELKRNENIHQDDYISTISASMDVPIYNNGGDKAYYVPAEDAIHLPPREVFDSDYAYNATALHELAHSSGAANRLNRDGITQGYIFGSPGYAYEELVAEMTACFAGANLMSDEIGMDEYIAAHAENHYKYVKNWAESIRADPNILIEAMYEAQLAADFLDVHGGVMDIADFNKKNYDWKMAKDDFGDVVLQSKNKAVESFDICDNVNVITQTKERHR